MKVRFITLGYISAVVLLYLILATSSHAAIDPDTAVAIWFMEDGEGDKVTEVTNNPAKLRGLL